MWAYLVTSSEKLNWLTSIFGGAAFVLLGLMAVTRSHTTGLKLGMAWHCIHLVGLHYVWPIFMQTFIGVALTSNVSWALVMSALGMVAPCVRLAAWTA